MNARHLTPSMSLLLVFESAARHESYTRAAEDLSLSQSAISKQVQALESHLGLQLFRREGRSVRLTDAGRRYYVELTHALGSIRSATLQAMSHQSGSSTLRLATLPTFGSKWLLPRIHEFYTANSGITIHLHSRIGDLNFDQGDLDAAITVGTGYWPDCAAHPLLNEQLVAIINPDAAKHSDVTPEWLGKQTLLTINSNPQAWADWFSHFDLPHTQMRMGPSFELTSHLIQAVRAGIGAGLVPRALILDELQRGELQTVGPALISPRSYYLVYPNRNASLPSLMAFREWLLQQSPHTAAIM